MTGPGTTAEQLRVLYGTDEPRARALALEAGALTAELFDGGVRAVAWNGVEIVRGIAFLIRDEAWGTLPARLSEPHVTGDGTGFTVLWSGQIGAQAGPSFAFEARIEGDADGRFAFTVEGSPDAELLTNRAGFVVLHPAHCAGAAVTLVHVDGRETASRFPVAISPGQPFLDLRAIRQRVKGVGEVTCRMEASLPGDPLGRFETEDQRNWCDASFKTYVGSLLHPWPYTLPAGSTFRQAVTVEIAPAAAVAATATGPRTAATPADLPAFGIGVPHGLDRAPDRIVDAARALRASFLVVTLDMRRDDTAAHLSAAARLAGDSPVQLEIVAPATEQPSRELADAAGACAAAGLRPTYVLVVPAPLLKSYQPSGPWPDLPPLAAWYDAAGEAFPDAAIGGGMATNFTELNRKRPAPEGLAFIAHGTTAIVHAADDRAVMETLETVPHIGRSVAALFPGVPYRLGPSSIAMRSNPYGATEPQNPGWTRMPLADRDPRQRGLYGAAWTVGFAAAAVDAGAAAVSLHATHGHLGIAEEDGLRPCFHALAALSRASGRPRVALSLPMGFSGLAWTQDDGTPVALVANLTDRPLAMPVAGIGRVLQAASASEARRDPGFLFGPPGPLPLELDAFAVALVDLRA